MVTRKNTCFWESYGNVNRSMREPETSSWRIKLIGSDGGLLVNVYPLILFSPFLRHILKEQERESYLEILLPDFRCHDLKLFYQFISAGYANGDKNTECHEICDLLQCLCIPNASGKSLELLRHHAQFIWDNKGQGLIEVVDLVEDSSDSFISDQPDDDLDATLPYCEDEIDQTTSPPAVQPVEEHQLQPCEATISSTVENCHLRISPLPISPLPIQKTAVKVVDASKTEISEGQNSTIVSLKITKTKRVDEKSQLNFLDCKLLSNMSSQQHILPKKIVLVQPSNNVPIEDNKITPKRKNSFESTNYEDENAVGEQCVPNTKVVFICPYCNHNFNAEYDLKVVHAKICFPCESLACKICEMNFNNVLEKVMHLCNVPPEKKPYKCISCGLAYGEKCILIVHQQQHKSKSLKCSKCPRMEFQDIDKLLGHVRKHTDEIDHTEMSRVKKTITKDITVHETTTDDKQNDIGKPKKRIRSTHEKSVPSKNYNGRHKYTKQEKVKNKKEARTSTKQDHKQLKICKPEYVPIQAGIYSSESSCEAIASDSETSLYESIREETTKKYEISKNKETAKRKSSSKQDAPVKRQNTQETRNVRCKGKSKTKNVVKEKEYMSEDSSDDQTLSVVKKLMSKENPKGTKSKTAHSLANMDKSMKPY